MSLSFQPLEAVTCLDPRMDLQSKREFAVMKGSSQTSWKQYTTSSVSQSSIQWSCNPPSRQVVIDRKVYMYLPIRLTFTGIPQGTAPNPRALLEVGADAPRAFPIANIIDTLNVTINNQSVSINLADIAQALLHYNTDVKLKNHEYSMTPNMSDSYQSYAFGNGTNRNPLGLYGDSLEGTVQSRGGFSNMRIVSNPTSANSVTTVTAVVDIAICEPIFLSPFYWGCSNAPGFYGVQTMDFNVNFIGQNAMGVRCWSHDDSSWPIATASAVFGGLPGGPTSFASTTGNQPTLLFQYLTPQETMNIPPDMPLTYPYADIQRYPTDFGVVSPGITTIVNSNNIQLSTIPRRMYIFAREKNNSLYSNTAATDTFLQISNISLQFQNKNGLLASASMNQLFEMSKKNHCNMTWTEFSGGPVLANDQPFSNPTYYGTIGSVVCVELASDIGLDSLDAPGKLTQSMVQISATVTNMNNRDLDCTLYIVCVLDGTFTIMGGQSTLNLGVITSKDILDANSKPYVNYRDIESHDGGDFLSGLKSVFGKVHDYIKDNKLVSRGLSLIPHPLGQLGSKAAEHFGYGAGEGYGRKCVAPRRGGDEDRDGYDEEGGLEMGDLVIGGKLMKRRDLKKRLQL